MDGPMSVSSSTDDRAQQQSTLVLIEVEQGQGAKQADLDAWDQFCRQSPQGNIFCDRRFIAAFDEPCHLFMVLDDGKPQLAVPILPQRPLYVPFAKGTTVRFSFYQGPMFAQAHSEMARHSALTYQMKLMEFALSKLAERFEVLNFGLHPCFDDLRSIQWFNYHDEAKGRFVNHLRYTAVYDLEQLANPEAKRGFRQSRRSELSRSLKDGVTVTQDADGDADLETLCSLIELNYLRQGLVVPDDESVVLRDIYRQAREHGFGEIFVARTASGEAASAAFCLYDSDTAYYLFAGNHPDHRRTGASTHVILHSMQHYHKRGLRYYDFVGINNPNWGDFKLSFDSRPVPYFISIWQGKQS